MVCRPRLALRWGGSEDALLLQRALADELAQRGAVDGYVYEEIAECLLLLDRSGEAQTYFALAYRELSQDVASRP